MYRDNTEKLIGRYCGTTAPGPVESNLGALGLKVILHSDSELVYSGFKARYTFEVAKPIFGGMEKVFRFLFRRKKKEKKEKKMCGQVKRIKFLIFHKSQRDLDSN